jgi:hypothetical protein
MRGWRRLGIVLSVIWFVGFFGWMWSHAADEATLVYRMSSSTCYHRYGSSTSQELDMAKYDVCAAEASAKLRTDYNAVRNFSSAGIVIAVDLALILLGWLIVWGIVAVVRWVARGFASA